MGLFSWKDEKCIDCGETENLNICDGDGCTNKMCSTHTYKLNREEYCSKCIIRKEVT